MTQQKLFATAFPEYTDDQIFRTYRTLKEDRKALCKKLERFEKDIISRLQANPEHRFHVDHITVELAEKTKATLDTEPVVDSLMKEDEKKLLGVIVPTITGGTVKLLGEAFPVQNATFEKCRHKKGTGINKIKVRKSKPGRPRKLQ
jgi:hypothetical protein